jgi:SAM-dependent methyltransferase
MSSDVPRKINLGSGKDFRDDFLNIDINDHWSPDVIADVSGDFPRGGSAVYPTRRFGAVTIAHGAYDEIICNDVLEHVPDLVATMTNCLKLLRVGGVFNVLVPYDLSYGAWQDPTHIRAFNERSWLYYTDWFWYLGWSDCRFVARNISFVPSELGHQLIADGLAKDIALRTPRAIDSMKATLEKIPLSDADRKTQAEFTGASWRSETMLREEG